MIKALPFSFLLALSVQQAYSETKIVTGPEAKLPARLFEQVTMVALSRYVGGPAIRIGFPRELPVPAGFSDCLVYLATEMREGVRNPLNPLAKDENVDVIAWKPFRDERGGQMIMLAQCKSGPHWDQDLASVDLEVWKQQMAWHAAPIKAFAFPYVFLGDASRWRYISVQGGVPFDRLRLSSLLIDVETDLLPPLKAWCDDFAGKLPQSD